MTLSNISLKKTFVSKTKLRHSRQKVINDCNVVEIMKNIRKKNIETYYIHESQKFLTFHDNETTQQKISKMIRTVRTIQVHDTLYFKKRK